MKQFVFFICILFLTINHAQAAGSDSAPEVAKPSSYKKVLSMIKKEQYADAITELEKILTNTNYASDPDILNHYAYSLRKTQNLIKAEEYYKKALSIDPGHRGALEYIGELYVDTKRLDLANATLKKLENCRCEEYAELKSYINK
ncbi:MAG: tetratricopeptide repeat protein [Proteobacteria bacterium]|jgi:tetratricopeptide (TPR) repeat protein|nr:tetratricopeptide repeat protein [Pseudomonadota bacterium]